MAHHLHTCNSKRFLTFNGHESNWHFDTRPFFQPYEFQSNEFWPLKSLSKDSKVHKDSNSQIGSPLGSAWAHSFTFFRSVNVIPKLHFQPAFFHAFALVANQMLGSWHLSWILMSFLLCACRNFLWTRRLVCWLVSYLRHSITFGCNNLTTWVFAFLLQCPTTTYEHSSNPHWIMPFYKEMHLGPI